MSHPSVPLVLASTSPRRRELVTLLGLAFETIVVNVDESPLVGESPEELVRRLCLTKAEKGRRLAPASLVAAADTVVAVDSHDAPGRSILGKPEDADDARRMLRQLRGREHVVYTGLAAMYGEREQVRVVQSTVWMRDYGDAEIDAYAASGDPLDKAAAYAIQNASFHPVARVEGCTANVMGLPLCHLYRVLRDLGIDLAEPDRACQDHLAIVCPVARDILREG